MGRQRDKQADRQKGFLNGQKTEQYTDRQIRLIRHDGRFQTLFLLEQKISF